MDNRDVPPSEEERTGYRQTIAILVVIIVAIIGLFMFYFYMNTPSTSSVIVKETTIQTVPSTNSTQPPVTRETTTIREEVKSTQPASQP